MEVNNIYYCIHKCQYYYTDSDLELVNIIEQQITTM